MTMKTTGCGEEMRQKSTRMKEKMENNLDKRVAMKHEHDI